MSRLCGLVGWLGLCDDLVHRYGGGQQECMDGYEIVGLSDFFLFRDMYIEEMRMRCYFW